MHSTIDHFEQHLQHVGERLGATLYHALADDPYRDVVQREKAEYVEAFGEGFAVYVVMVYGWPIVSSSPLAFAYPPYIPEVAGFAACFVGVIWGTTDLYDNFLREMRRGRTLALRHAGVAFFLTGAALQTSEHVESTFAGMGSNGVTESIGIVIPLLIVPLAGLLFASLYWKVTSGTERSGQTRLDSPEEWED